MPFLPLPLFHNDTEGKCGLSGFVSNVLLVEQASIRGRWLCGRRMCNEGSGSCTAREMDLKRCRVDLLHSQSLTSSYCNFQISQSHGSPPPNFVLMQWYLSDTIIYFSQLHCSSALSCSVAPDDQLQLQSRMEAGR